MRVFMGILIGLFITSTAFASKFTLTSPAFPNDGKIPTLYTCDGDNSSPELRWNNAPTNTQSYVLILNSPDWPEMVYLWVLYNIPNDLNSLPKAANKHLPDNIATGNNYFYETTYRGPCPPDSLVHHYVFTLYALDKTLDLPPGADVNEVLSQMGMHIIQETKLIGLFSH